MKKWEENNKDRMREWRRQYNKDNKEYIMERYKKYKELNKQKLYNYYKQYYKQYYKNIKSKFPNYYNTSYIVNRKINTKNYIRSRYYGLLKNKIKVPRLYKFRNDYYKDNENKISLLLNSNNKDYMNKYKQFKKEINDEIENDSEYNQQCEDECNHIADEVFYLSKGKTYTDWFDRNLLND